MKYRLYDGVGICGEIQDLTVNTGFTYNRYLAVSWSE